MHLILRHRFQHQKSEKADVTCIPKVFNHKHQSTVQIGTKTLQSVKENGIINRQCDKF